MRFKIPILIVLLLSVTIFIPAHHANATEIHNWLGGNGDITQSYYLDVVHASGTCTPAYDGGNDRINGCTPSVGSGVGVHLNIDIPDLVVSKISFTYEWNSTRAVSGERGTSIIAINGDDSLAESIANHTNITAEGSSGSTTITYDGSPVTVSEIWLGGSVRNNNGSDGSYYRVVSIIIESPDGEYYRPLFGSDRHQWGSFTSDDNFISLSNSPGAFVYSAFAGEVTRIQRINAVECREITSPDAGLFDPVTNFLGVGCFISIPEDVHGGTGTFSYALGRHNLDVFNPGDRMSFYVVEIYNSDDDITARYLVDDADEYLFIGAIIDAGCYLGKTLTMRGADVQIGLPISIQSEVADQGVTIMEILEGTDGDRIEAEPLLTLNPIPGNACNSKEETSDCLYDSELLHPEDWNTQGNVGFDNPGATLGPNAAMNMTLNLDETREPRVRVNARAYASGARMTVVLGETSQTFDVSTGSEQDYIIEGAQHQADTGVFYTLLVSNAGNSTIEIEYVCVSFTKDSEGGDLYDPPDRCYFNNNSFSDNATGWNIPGIGTTVYTYPGELRMDNAQTFAQDVTLHPGDYTISVEASIWHNNNYELDETDTTSNLTMEYDFPSGGGFSSIDSATFAEFADGLNLLELSANFTIGSSTSGSFVLRPTLVTAVGAVRGVAIREVCLNPADNGEFPPDPESPDGGNEPFPELDENCEVIERPVGNSVPAWIGWHWYNLNQFFECDLMVLLNAMFDLGNRTYRLIGWQARYWQSTMLLAIDWMSLEFLPWLGGYLANASGSVYITTVDSGESSCEWYDLLCHLTNVLDIGGGFFDSLFDLLSQVISDVISPIISIITDIFDFILGLFGYIIQLIMQLLFAVLVEFLELFNLARDIFFNLIDAYNNSPPETLPGVPNCSAGEDNMVCWTIFTMEQTILSGNEGQLIIPIFTSLLAILMTIYFASQLKKLLQEASLSI